MTVLSILVQVLIVLGIFNFASLPYLVLKGQTDLSKHTKKLLISELMFLAIMNNAKIKLTVPTLCRYVSKKFLFIQKANISFDFIWIELLRSMAIHIVISK